MMWLSQWGGESAIRIILEKKDEVGEKGTLGSTLDNALRELFRDTTCYFQIIFCSLKGYYLEANDTPRY